MKALVVTPYYYPVIGGLETYAQRLNIALANDQKWDIVVVTSTNGHRQEQDIVDGQKVYRLGTSFKLSNTPFNPLWPRMIRAIIEREKPDVILAHSPVPSMADAAASAKGSTPFVLIYHAATLLKAGSPLFNIAARSYSMLQAATFRRADQIFAVSEFVRDELTSRLQEKTIVVPNSVWKSEIVARTQPKKTNFVFIATLDKSRAWKGLSQIIEAVAVYHERYKDDIKLTIIGDGNMRQEYERQVRVLGLVRQIHFVGALIDPEKTQIVRHATGMVIYPTTENDAFPTVMLEAWANYVPIVAARIGALASLVHHNEDGLLCNPGQPDALADALHELTLMPDAQRERIAETAALRTTDHYTWERQAEFVAQRVKGLL